MLSDFVLSGLKVFPTIISRLKTAVDVKKLLMNHHQPDNEIEMGFFKLKTFFLGIKSTF